MDSNEKFKILNLLKELENVHYPAGPLYQRINSCKALINENDNELESIYYLSETHSPGLRSRTVLRYEKLLANDPVSQNITHLQKSRDNLAFKCSTYPKNDRIRIMLEQMQEMPKEWTVVQLTPQYNSRDILNEDNNVYHTNPIHISVFSCGQNETRPFLINVGAPKDPVTGNNIELAQEMNSIVKGNIEVLTSNKKKMFRNQKEKMDYIERRQLIEDRLRNIVKVMQDMWLKEWRCLLTGKYCDENLEEKIKTEMDTYFKKEVTGLEITKKTEYILCSALKNCLHLKLNEVKKIVQFCFPDLLDKILIRNIVQFIRSLGNKLITKGVNTKKYPVILVLHDTLDCFPWEMIDVLQDESVSRLPSLHFVYCLFKEHQNDIVDGHKVITSYDKGTYIVNPDMDLQSMETRMMNFFNYWTPGWTGTSGYQPSKDEFFELLTSSDIFSYIGHGSGSHLMSMDKIQKTHVKAVVLLFGCGSTKITRLDPQVEMFGHYHMYLIARCPCVVGMLWEVTDIDTDTLTSDFLSHWIPSEAPIHWKYVDKTKWKKAEEKIKLVRNVTILEDGQLWEPELLRALVLAKKGLRYNMTKAACVVRGLPVIIKSLGSMSESKGTQL
ncbi:extra spindle pole bodies like 1, separase [Leptinotarsa decemlineata]|uniref:extra spindle pole bodies like 1, separase n=1 Tax=Leptinotarsa decemlineata TaxID=7539 RepID=UPI003D30D7A8